MKVILLIDPLVDVNRDCNDSVSRKLKTNDWEALQFVYILKQSGQAKDVLALSVSPQGHDINSGFYKCFAYGVDRGVHIISNVNQLWDYNGISTIIYNFIQSNYEPQIILCGSDAFGRSPVGSDLASMLDYQYIGGAQDLQIAREKNIIIKRYLGRGFWEEVRSSVPLVIGVKSCISIDLKPLSLIDIKKAKEKPLKEYNIPIEEENIGGGKLALEEIRPYKIPVSMPINFPINASARDRMQYFFTRIVDQKSTQTIIENKKNALKSFSDLIFS